jgi:CheY-like chemotaxis protein
LHFTVSDTGIGIAPEDQPRLFKPFVQLDSRLARQYAGSGLGLSLVRRMAEMHGGGVRLASAPGAGSRFTISLPWRRPPAEADAVDLQLPAPAADWAGSAAAPLGRAPVVLLADDNEANLSVLSQYLARCQFQLVTARTGPEVLLRAAETCPDVILLDVQMPEMDGLEVTRRLRATAGLTHVPVVTLTALAMAGDRERCLAAGADDYLSKPVSLKQLRTALDTQLRRARRGC